MKKLVLIILTLLLIGGGTAAFLAYQTHVEAAAAVPTLSVEELWRDTNIERQKAGLQPVDHSQALDQSAAARCNDMSAKHYFDHIAPDGTKPESYLPDMLHENIAEGYTSSQQTIDAWMASPGHRSALLDPADGKVGFSFCQDGPQTYVVQHFIR